ncbi:hypothetical protein [Nonomuraea typhae]|uniref:hypothetical protein n=1 Tax=Nonomuraea typhae TaxID=2603600 RepID=UPI0012FAF6F6|nr:hypothetical protein [Nonomuraea typhae]
MDPLYWVGLVILAVWLGWRACTWRHSQASPDEPAHHECTAPADTVEALEADLEQARKRLAAGAREREGLRAELTAAHLAYRSAEAELKHVRAQTSTAVDEGLLKRIDELEALNALLTDNPSRSEVLRLRETIRRLDAEVTRLSLASQAADVGVAAPCQCTAATT